MKNTVVVLAFLSGFWVSAQKMNGSKVRVKVMMQSAHLELKKTESDSTGLRFFTSKGSQIELVKKDSIVERMDCLEPKREERFALKKR